jgi:purine-binding chemotaxis protein CheW
MNDPNLVPPAGDELDDQQGRHRPSMMDRLQQALRSLGGDRARLAAGGSLSPDALAELAQRAGLSTPEQVADLTRMMGGAIPGGAPDPAVPQHIVFALGEVECALPAGSVQGVERISDLAPVPNTVSWVMGVVHLRGAIVSVVDLSDFFGLPARPLTPRSRLLVVTRDEMTIGCMVDAVTEMRPLDEELARGQSAPMPAWAQPYARSALLVDGRAVIALDPERLLRADKMHRYRADFG